MFALLTMGGGAFVIILGGELVLRMFFPEEILFPRMEHSEAYGFWNPKSTQMVHARPGRWRFVYTTNRYRSRGPVTPVSNHYEKINVVTIGDSFTFGTGVDDGEEYPAIMHGQLENRFNVINIAVGGFGLAQQIRRYYEFGQLYHPKIVVSQFCINDPGDNFRNRVTRIEDGRFVFEDVGYPGRFQLWLSRSYLLQHSQTYSFLRNRFYLVPKALAYMSAGAVAEPSGRVSPSTTEAELFHNELLDLFARDLHEKGVRMLMIAVDEQLETFPLIKRKVEALDREGVLDYLEVADWLEDSRNYASPEGHDWGTDAHRIIGTELSRVIRAHEG